MRHIPLGLASLVAIFLVAPMAIIVPMSFSTAISFEFPPPGYWTGYYAQYFPSHAWLEATANSFIIAFGSMVFTLAVALPASFGFVRYRFYGKSTLNLLMMLPVLRPGILVGALFAFLHSFNEAVVAIFIAGRDASTLPKKMFESIRLESDPVIAVVSTLLTGAVLSGVLISLLFRQRSAQRSAHAN